jgi:hypothetical protein
MSVGTAIVVAALVLVGIEVLNVFLDLWSDRIADRLRARLRRAPPKHPWTDRTGT